MKPKTVRKFVTVTWSVTVERDLPADIGLDELNDFVEPFDSVADEVIKEAGGNLNWRDGMITDVIDA